MTIDKHTLDKAREWATENLEKGHFLHGGRVMAAAEVIQSLPDEWIDTSKLREALDWRDSKPSGDDYDGEFYDRLRALLPAPAPQVEIALGAWAMHPEHGKVLILSEHIDRDGEVCITWEGLESFHSEMGRWVPAADLSPVPDDQFSDLPEAALETLKASVEDHKSGRFVDVDLDQGSNCQGTLNSSPEPQPGEAWEFVYWGERFVGLATNENNLLSIRCGGSGPRNIKAEDAEALRRLVPAQEPRVLTSEQDYREAADDTIVRRPGNANAAYEKWSHDEWRSTAGTNHTDREMAENSGPRTVLWEPDA